MKLRHLLLFLALPLSGCATVGYYSQALRGQLDILARARPIEELLAEGAQRPGLKERLEKVLEMRVFASRALLLPDNDSYRRYADLERPYALWNVFAAPELALKLREWCFPVAGCVAYRGYFTHAGAEAFAAEQRAQGEDVYVGGVLAYSTLGWFDDPLLNTMVDRPEAEVAGLIFHELAHQKLYVRDDTAFNESFATVVEIEGVRRWLEGRGALEKYTRYTERRARREQFTQLLLGHRARLEALYASDASDAQKRADKQRMFDELRREYEELKKSWNGYDGFDGWMRGELNNARLASVGLYHRHVPAFRALLAQQQGDLVKFYREAERLAALAKEERTAQLEKLNRQD